MSLESLRRRYIDAYNDVVWCLAQPDFAGRVDELWEVLEEIGECRRLHRQLLSQVSDDNFVRWLRAYPPDKAVMSPTAQGARGPSP